MMHSDRPHPLLAQIPLTVSPFISLPTAPTLPYTYKPLPSTLPASSTADANGNEREAYVVSASGHAASPADIIASCQSLQNHIQKLQNDAEKTLKDWETGLKEQELAEKRRVAPGWLDREEKILEPARASSDQSTPVASQFQGASLIDQQDHRNQASSAQTLAANQPGDELDRAFGGMAIQKEQSAI